MRGIEGVYLVTYIIFSVPGTLLAKAWLPSRSIALGALVWSIAASGMGGARVSILSSPLPLSIKTNSRNYRTMRPS